MNCQDCNWFSREVVSPYSDDPLINKCDKNDRYLDDRFCYEPETPEWCPEKKED